PAVRWTDAKPCYGPDLPWTPIGSQHSEGPRHTQLGCIWPRRPPRPALACTACPERGPPTRSPKTSLTDQLTEGHMITSHSHSTGPKPDTAVPVTARDLCARAGYTALAVVLLAALRHYAGKPKQVRRAKFKHDSFPLSTYPMFSTDRKGRIIVPHVVGLTAEGERILLHHRHYGTGGLNQVRKQIARGVRGGH